MDKSSMSEPEKLINEQMRREVMKGVEEIRKGQGIIYQSAEDLAEAVIKKGKARKAKQQSKTGQNHLR